MDYAIALLLLSCLSFVYWGHCSNKKDTCFIIKVNIFDNVLKPLALFLASKAFSFSLEVKINGLLKA